MIEIVSATRFSAAEFWDKAALGISLRRLAKDTRLVARIAFENRRGLSLVFNESIDTQDDVEFLVFIHDDVWIDSDTFADDVIAGLKSFDVIGVAGNRRRVKNQPGWAYIDEKLTWESVENVRGRVAHGRFPFGEVSVFGETPAECELLDGVLIAASKTKLKATGVQFDPRFDFHFYDLDFCRSARANDLKLGVWPISLTHQSGGAFGSKHWRDNRRLYLEKWESLEANQAAYSSSVAKSGAKAPSIFSAQIFQHFKKSPAPKVLSSNLFLPQGDLLSEATRYKKLGNEFLAEGELANAAECYAHAVAVNPTDAEGFINLGFVLKEQLFFKDAERYLKQAIRINPKLEDAYYLLGVVAQGLGNIEAAIEQFNKLVELNPGFEIVYGDLSNAYLQSGQIESAKNILLKGIEQFPKQADLYFNLGNIHNHERELEKAVDCFLHVLEIQPDYVEARSNLGLVYEIQDKLDDAIEQYRIALSVMPDYAELHNNLGHALQLQGKQDAAVESYYRAIEYNSDIDIAHTNLLSVLQSQGKLAEAEKHYRQMLLLKPGDAALHVNLGNILQSQDRREDAVMSYQHALTLKPDWAEVHNNLGYVFQALGQLDEAVVNYRQALALKAEFPQAQWNLVNLLQIQGKLEEEIERYRDALLLNSTDAPMHEQLGYALRALDKRDEAVEHFRLALSFKKDSAESYNKLGHALQAQHNYQEAEECYRHAISLKPNFAEFHNSLGYPLQSAGKLDEAIQCYRHALLLKPDYVDAHNNLAHTLQAQGRYDEAIECYRRALTIKPDHFKIYSNLLFLLSSHINCSPSQYLAEAKHYGAIVSAQAQPYSQWSGYLSEEVKQPIRVGLVSADLKDHPVGFFLESILSCLDSDRLSLVAYPTVAEEDELTARIKPHFSAWNSIAGMNDKEAARRIHEDNIHILIDLSGHTAHNRLSVFAWKPAPVQVSWLGYFASTGVQGVDFLLADRVSVPESHQEHFTETVWYLPDTRLCFTAPTTEKNLTSTPLPANSCGYITFGCFQRMTKINDAVLALWGKIFHSLPQAKLRLQNNEMKSPAACEEILQRLARVGIGSERVILEGAVPRKDYLLAHARVDIILDTFPYPGGTTTCEAMWMGVPTLTLAGDTLLSRQGASLLACAGLEDWIASDGNDYVARALAHAADLTQLAKLRLGLRQQVLSSPLFDAPRFARNLEDAFLAMWQQKVGLNHNKESR